MKTRKSIPSKHTPNGRADLRSRERVDSTAAHSETPIASSTPGNELHKAWNRQWRAWDRIIRETNRDNSKYIRNDTSVSPSDLDDNRLTEDLDRVATELLSLVSTPLFFENIQAVDWVDKIVSSLGKVAKSHIEFLAVQDVQISLGPATVQLLLDGCWRRAASQKQPAVAMLAELAKVAFSLAETDVVFLLEEVSLKTYFRDKSVGEREALRAGVEAIRATPWNHAFDEFSAPGSWVVQVLSVGR